tara:strand:+ start:11199 stop:12875 length:1677 start_codon:yes stop_codon:yes gene_type:complete
MATTQEIAASAQAAGLKAHKNGDLVTAEKLYRRCLAFGEAAIPEVFANYGALLRELQKPKEAISVYRRGIKKYPEHNLLIRNYGNLLLQEGQPAKALALYLKAEKYLPQNSKPGKLVALQRQQAQALSELGQPRLALRILEPMLQKEAEDDIQLIIGMAQLYLDLGNVDKARSLALPVLDSKEPNLEQAYQWSNLLLKLEEFDQALETFDKATVSHRRRASELDKKTKEQVDSTCWNFSLMLLRRGLLERGWQLFEHGRAVPNGRGGMQRTVFKSHPRAKIAEWNGSQLKNKKLLINGEQGIGDVMMFSMLIPPLSKESEKIGIITYDRLKTLYERAFPEAQIFDTKNLKDGSIKPEDWDLQVAMGSIPMLRHTRIGDYSNLEPFLKIDKQQKSQLKQKYYPKSKGDKLIGFSWKGGGNAKQKKTKSLQLEDMLELFRVPNTKWISLQYGEVNDEIRDFNTQYGLDLITPDDVDPLKDMDRWCALVSCCDRVISAANTTIHGAGCLGIPTTVILARDPDWRWLGDEDAKCYWYKSVSIARQKVLGSWEEPIKQVLNSL